MLADFSGSFQETAMRNMLCLVIIFSIKMIDFEHCWLHWHFLLKIWNCLVFEHCDCTFTFVDKTPRLSGLNRGLFFRDTPNRPAAKQMVNFELPQHPQLLCDADACTTQLLILLMGADNIEVNLLIVQPDGV
jgi:hypothetical protein